MQTVAHCYILYVILSLAPCMPSESGTGCATALSLPGWMLCTISNSLFLLNHSHMWERLKQKRLLMITQSLDCSYKLSNNNSTC